MLKLIPTLVSDFLELESNLPNQEEILDYEWNFLQREGKDENCPYAMDSRNDHKQNCICFVKNLEMVPGWEDNMGDTFGEQRFG